MNFSKCSVVKLRIATLQELIDSCAKGGISGEDVNVQVYQIMTLFACSIWFVCNTKQ